jgi:hypothetical protein
MWPAATMGAMTPPDCAPRKQRRSRESLESRRPPERGGAPDTLLGYHTAVADPVR